jgi:hypothetical protein
VAGVVVDRHALEAQHEMDLLRVPLDPFLAAAEPGRFLVEVGGRRDAAELAPASASTAASSMLPDTDRTIRKTR